MKLDDRAKRCIFIGYTETASIWKLYDLVRKLAFTSRDVIFDDNTVYKHLVATPENISVKPVPPVLMCDPDLTPYWFDEGPVLNDEDPVQPVPEQHELIPVPERQHRRFGRDDLSINMHW